MGFFQQFLTTVTRSRIHGGDKAGLHINKPIKRVTWRRAAQEFAHSQRYNCYVYMTVFTFLLYFTVLFLSSCHSRNTFWTLLFYRYPALYPRVGQTLL